MQGIRGYWKLAASAAVAAVLVLQTPALAQKADIQKQLEKTRASEQKLSKKSQELEKEVSGLKSELVGVSGSLRETSDSIAAAGERLKTLKEEKESRLQRLYKDQKSLGGLVSAAGKYATTSTPDLLAQSSPLQAARAALVMKSVIPTLSARSKLLKDEIDDLDRIESEIAEKKSEKEKEINKLNKKIGNLDVLLKKRQELYKKTDSERKEQQRLADKLSREAKNIDDLVKKIKPASKQASSFKLPGGITPPVSGRIHTGFGETDDLGAKSEGVTFAGEPGSVVVSPIAGTVKFAGPFQKFKQILIIEHPGGYHSLIAGLGSIDTVVGAPLSAGEPVGKAGFSPDSSQVYYELRQGGEPVNPQKLILAQKKQEKS